MVAEYLTVSKQVTPGTVGIGTEVTYTLNYYVSEYYTVTNAVLTDILPDGLTFVSGSGSQTPTFIHEDTPGNGQTEIIWELSDFQTRPGRAGSITFRAVVDATYEAAPLAGEPVVAGDS